jgi:hypothetical protein
LVRCENFGEAAYSRHEKAAPDSALAKTALEGLGPSRGSCLGWLGAVFAGIGCMAALTTAACGLVPTKMMIRGARAGGIKPWTEKVPAVGIMVEFGSGSKGASAFINASCASLSRLEAASSTCTPTPTKTG